MKLFSHIQNTFIIVDNVDKRGRFSLFQVDNDLCHYCASVQEADQWSLLRRLGWITCKSMLRVILVVMLHDIVRFLNCLSVLKPIILQTMALIRTLTGLLLMQAVWGDTAHWSYNENVSINISILPSILSSLNYSDRRWTQQLEGCLQRTEPEPDWY